MYRRSLLGLFAGLVATLCACGGGGGGGTIPGTIATPTPTPAPTPATATSSIGVSGGILSVTVNGSAVQLTVPADAVITSTTWTLSVYPADTTAKPFTKRRATPAGATFLLGFTVSDGGLAIYKPLTLSFTGPLVAGGNTIRLAMYGAKSGAYNDVDTASESGAIITNQNAVAYVGISTVTGSADPYAFYAIASSAAATPAPITLGATSATTQPFAIQSSVTFNATGADANGNAYAFVPSFALSNTALGTLSVQLAPYLATLTTGTTSATGNLVISDPVKNLSGNVKIDVASQRPATSGDTYNYTGAWSQTFARSGQPQSTTSATLAESVSVTPAPTFNGVSGLDDFHAVDVSTANLTTTTLTTDEYDSFSGASPVQFLTYGNASNDGEGNTSVSTFATPQVLDQLPEISGASWTNNGAVTIADTDASTETSTQTYAADGTYNESITYPANSVYYTGPAPPSTVTEQSDGSGDITLNLYGATYTATNSAPVSGSIAIAETQSYPNPTPTPYTQTVGVWFTAPPVLYAETDSNMGAASLPASCKTGSPIPTSVNKLVQLISRLDTVFGYTDAEEIDSYVATGYGAVCSVMTDTLTQYYNVQGDIQPGSVLFSPIFSWSSTPYQVTTTTQLLALQSGAITGIDAAHRLEASAMRAARAGFEARVRAMRLAIQKGAHR
ncbi:MAG: hypothetical protein WA629_05075 [Candidatus Aquilonibacter sp.]